MENLFDPNNSKISSKKNFDKKCHLLVVTLTKIDRLDSKGHFRGFDRNVTKCHTGEGCAKARHANMFKMSVKRSNIHETSRCLGDNLLCQYLSEKTEQIFNEH